ncbi:Fructose dehydrogenase large subunit [Botrimarina hoheduenensis]|uniref:Fructose dehydrogenase large subunit n=1 Tax=Botrimarina hoheduenensis TaxID=2528000 RepID=A0A5C5WB20_9BACT|nr:Fructose dehydrogenase large subunit [Botrimarina hoheduenensis]
MVIVGAGAVGLHLAVQLVRRGCSVVVLEAGDRTLSNFDETAFRVSGRSHQGVKIGRSISLGGTSNLWGGQLVEFQPVDIEGRSWLEGSRWPVSYDEVASYYSETYSALGSIDELQQDASVWAKLKKTPPELSQSVEVFLTRWMNQPNLAHHYRAEVESDHRIKVVLDARTVGFTFYDTTVKGVKVVDSKGKTHIVSGDRIVLAAGTIENARLLLHSAEQSDCPWRTNDNIGRYFQDHLGGRLAYIKPRNRKAFYDAFCTIVCQGAKFQPKVRLRNGMLQERPLLNCQAMIAFESSISENLVFLKQFVKAAVYSRKIGSITGFFRNLLACSRHMIPLMWKFVVEHRILIPSGSRIALIVQSEVEPLRDSRISVDRTRRDRYGLPQAVIDWRLSGREMEAILDFTERVRNALEQAQMADLEIEPALAAKDKAFLDTLHDTNHHAGGCVMGNTAVEGVVDRDLRVFGTNNFYVAGASVFRTSSNANTTFTAMALATRLADHLTDTADAKD